MSLGVQADFSGLRHVTESLKNYGRAMRFQATRWASETTRDAKRAAAAMQKGYKMGHGKTGQLARAVGMKVTSDSRHAYIIAIGTGVRTPNPIKYARIQDEGGVIKAKNAFFTIGNMAGRPRIGPFLTIPLKGIKGRMADYEGAFVIRSEKTGNFVVVQQKTRSRRARGFFSVVGSYHVRVPRNVDKGESGLRPLFILKSQVEIPASRWFSGTIEKREPVLAEMMDPVVVGNIAEQMTGMGRGMA